MSDSSLKKKMLSTAEIEQGIDEVAVLAKAEGVSVILVGGVAMHHYGSDRFTADLDFASAGPLSSLPVESLLVFGGYQSHTPSGVPVDWIVRSDDYKNVFEEALAHPMHAEELAVPVVAPEYLVAMKMVARRRKDEVDLEMLLELGVVDEAKALSGRDYAGEIKSGDIVSVEVSRKPDFWEENWYKIITATAVMAGVYTTLK